MFSLGYNGGGTTIQFSKYIYLLSLTNSLKIYLFVITQSISICYLYICYIYICYLYIFFYFLSLTVQDEATIHKSIEFQHLLGEVCFLILFLFCFFFTYLSCLKCRHLILIGTKTQLNNLIVIRI